VCSDRGYVPRERRRGGVQHSLLAIWPLMFCRNGGRILRNICLFGKSLASFARQIFNCMQPSQYCSYLWDNIFRGVYARCIMAVQSSLRNDSSAPYIQTRSCAISSILGRLSKFAFCHSIYLCLLCMCRFQTIHVSHSSQTGIQCREISSIVEVPDTMPAAEDHVHSAIQRPLVSLSTGYLTSLTIVPGLGQLHSVDTLLLALCRARTTQYPQRTMEDPPAGFLFLCPLHS
jgi:hypothetical protein